MPALNSIDPPEILAGGLLSGEYGGIPYRLTPPQTRILYALAESDYGWLTLPALYEILFRLHRRQLRGEVDISSGQAEKVQRHLPELVRQGWVTVDTTEPGDLERVQLAQAGNARELITWLTRRWQGWGEYSKQHDLFHY